MGGEPELTYLLYLLRLVFARGACGGRGSGGEKSLSGGLGADNVGVGGYESRHFELGATRAEGQIGN